MSYTVSLIKKDARSYSTETKEALRFKAVESVLNGKSQTETARIFGVARQTVVRWMGMYRKNGKRSLKAHKQGRPKGHTKLRNWQAAITVRSITDETPDQLKMPFMLWTREAVREFVGEKFKIQVSLSTVGRWLRKWGFTPQKPIRRAWEQNPEAVRKWLDEEYPRIRKDARKENAEIHWGDEMDLRSDHQAFRGFGRKGITPVIPGTGQRFGCNMISTITNRGTLRFMVFHGRFTSKTFINFLGRLIKGVGQKIYLIVDGHPVHKSRKVETWLAKHEEKIAMFRLPPYSPELNPDEMLNNDVKANAVGKRRSKNRDEMMEEVRGYLRCAKRNIEIVKRYFYAPTVRYAMD
jgi:transposase